MSNIVAKDVDQTNSLVWFRNDLRVNDHHGLKQAIENSDSVVGFYCFNPDLFVENKLGFKKTDKFRAKFLIETLENLKKNLKKINITLIIKIGDSAKILSELTSEKNIKNIYLQEEWTKEESDELSNLKNILNDVVIHSNYDQFLFHPEDIDSQYISDVFTNFRKYCEKKVDVRSISTMSKKFGSENLINEDFKVPSLKILGFDDFELDKRSAFIFKGGSDSAKELSLIHI